MVVDACPRDVISCMRLLDVVGVPALCLRVDGVVLGSNEAWALQVGSSDDTPWSWLALLPPDSAARTRRALEAGFSSGIRIEIEIEVRRPDGSVREFAFVSGVHETTEPHIRSTLVLAWDVTERKRNEQRLAFMAGHDTLTGLPNRRTFLEALDRALLRASRGTPSSLLLLDVDHLKSVNDTLGHVAGDQALVNLAFLLRKHMRATDVPARVGGDEFAVVLDGASLEEAAAIADRMRAAASSRELVPGAREHRLGISGGLALIEAGADQRAVIDRADVALYAAKAEGRDRIVEWTSALGGTARSERPAARVREAFASDGFTLVFQPVVRLSDRSVEYFESLVRMRSDDGSLLGPDEFLPIVERSGQMARLTRRVVELALWELSSVRECSVSVNLSPSDLADDELLADLARTLEAAEVSRSRLAFEVSESTLLANLAQGRRWMERLGSLGCRFVLDDFGSGSGMFVLLKEGRISQVKLSRSVVWALSSVDDSHDYVVALRTFIESQGKVAVATFVETARMMDEVERAGFSLGQGFNLSEPAADLRSLCEEFAVART